MEREFENRKPIKSIIKIVFSNIVKLLSGFLVAFLLPKVIGISDYGYYKTFTLYSSYVALLAIGITDGIYLKYGGIPYNELSKTKFSFYSKVYILLQIILSVIPAIFVLVFLEGDSQFLFVALAVYTIFSNITGYYQTISQITCRFTELSRRNLIQSALMGLFIFLLWITNKYLGTSYNYKVFIIGFITIFCFLSLWYLYTYREITFSKTPKEEKKVRDVLEFVKIGLPLLICNLSVTLIFSLDRQFVQIAFSIEEYATYAFAYNMLSLITTATSAISIVLYPIMKQETEENIRNKYSNLVSIVLIFIFACLICYFPLVIFVENILKDYIESLTIFRIILPGLALSSCITIIMHNYFKVLGKNNLFLVITLVIMVISALANYLAYIIFGSREAISWASIIVMSIWYLACDIYFCRKYKVNIAKNAIYLLFMSISFYLITMIPSWWLAMIIYFIVFLILFIFLYFKEIQSIIIKIKKK